MAIRFLSNQTINGTLDLTNRVKVSGNSTDQYFYEGERTGVGVTLRLYDNANTIYFDGYTGIVLRANQIGGSGGSIVFTGGNVGVGMVPAASVAFDVKEADTANDLIVGLTAGTGARAQIRSVVQSANTESAISFHTTLSSSTQEKLRILATGALSVGNSGTNYGTSGQVLTSTGNAVPQWTTPTTGTITGSGTANKVTKFTGATAIGDGPITFSTNDSTFAGDIIAKEGLQASKFETDGNDLVLSANTTQTNVSPNIIFKSSVTGGSISEKMRVDSSGNLLIGKTSANNGTVGTQIMSTGDVNATVSGDTVARFNRLSSDGEILRFQKDTTTVGSIGSNSAGGNPVLDIASSSSTSLMRFLTSGSERIRIDSDGRVMINQSSNITGQALQVNGFIDITKSTTNAIRFFDNTTFRGGLGLDSWATGGSASDITMFCQGAFGIVTGGGNTKKLVMDTSGNVGIGTTSPQSDARLHTYRNSTDAFNIFESSANKWVFGEAGGVCQVGGKYGTHPGIQINTSGNVGIGEISPDSKLHVKGDMVTIEDPSGGFKMELSADNNPVTIMSDNLTGAAYGEMAFVAGNGSGANDQERMRITSAGNVGIGTTSPNGVKFQTVQTTSGEWTGGFKNYTANGYGLRVDMSNSSSVQSALQVYTGAGTGFVVKNTGNVGIGTFTPNKKLTVYGGNDNGIWIDSQGAQYTSLAFCNNGTEKANIAWDNTNGYTNISTYGNGHLAMSTGGSINAFLNSSGNFGIGTTSPQKTLDVTGTLAISNNTSSYWDFDRNNSNGTLQIADTGTDRMSLTIGGTLTVSGDVVAYGSPSDVRLKENIKTIESALDKVSKLQGVTFDWKKSDNILDIKEDIGFIAQDVQKVVPELVRENEDGMLSMRHQGVVPILLEAIKELEARVKELEKKQ